MRFKKSIKICPGVKVNFSKSGVSTTFGEKGISVNVGKKGTYLNTRISGTGLYDRTKIGDGSSGKRNSLGSSNSQNSARNILQSLGDITFEYYDDGTLKFFNNGVEITDKATVNVIKKNTGFQRTLAEINARRIEEYRHQTAEFTDIQSKARKVYSDVESLCASLKCKEYIIGSFPEVLPTDVELKMLAEKELGKKLFGGKSRITEYINTYKTDYYNRRAAFDLSEIQKKIAMDAQFRDEHENMKKRLRTFASQGKEETEKRINSWLESIEFPFEFDIQYDIQGGKIMVDFDLPEIEDIPVMTTQTMASGVVKIKEKTKKEIKQNYSDCVFGLAVYFASGFFNVAMAYDEVVLSAYTQRRNNKGRINNDYILSVQFDRIGFSKLDYRNSAKSNCMKFENICLQNADMYFKVIEPFE